MVFFGKQKKCPKMFSIKFVIILLIYFAQLSASVSEYDDEYYDSNKERILESAYHGLIKENETFVDVRPLIKVDETKICDLRIIKRNTHEVPFQVEMVNGLGILKATKTLNCEKHKNFKFDIVAVFCDGSFSQKSVVRITVIDINEYSPTFLQPSYVTEVDEGRLYQEIIRVEATDRDCTPLFGDVCKYEILTHYQPFAIDNEGTISNTEPLSHKVSQNHILSVVAYDCAMKQSAPVMVNIRVRRVCETKVQGIADKIEYKPGSLNSVPLFPKLHLELCDIQCKNFIIQSVVSLKTEHISFGCDRDTTQCETKNSLINLLAKNVVWTKDLIFDEGVESVFHFDGTNGATIPWSVVSHHDFALHPFTIVTMFRHHSLLDNDKHIKEHIICSADDHKKNRHHMALFVRNCRLILLLRKNSNEGDLNVFSPAEWRWKIPHVCDNEWHQYTLNIDMPKVELFIDGVKFEANSEDRHSNPEVIDDWPLHAAHGVNTTLTIGACYQGSEDRLKHGFIGDIAEIKLSLNKTLSQNDIECGNECVEHLIPPPEHYLESSQQIQVNNQLNEIIIDGNNKTNIELLLQKISYVNLKPLPTIGRRNVEIRTTISCLNKKSIRLPTVDTFVMVLSTGSDDDIMDNGMPFNNRVHDKPITDEQKPQIIINGTKNNLVTYTEIKQGVRILSNIDVTVFSGNLIKPHLQKLDSCKLDVWPSLNPDHEEITSGNDNLPIMDDTDDVNDDDSDDDNIDKNNIVSGNIKIEKNGKMISKNDVFGVSATFDIKTNISKDGVEMTGYDTIRNYMKVLRSLVYTNKKPAYYLNRVFKLTCTQLNAHFKSAEYTLTLTILHPKQMPTSGPKQQMQHDSNSFAHAMIHSNDVQESFVKIHTIVQKPSQTHSTLLIAVICTSFILLICGIGIARLRNSSKRNLEKHQACPRIAPDQQLDWDDSALTITINPMQNGGIGGALSEDSSDSENSDTDDDDGTTGRYKNVSQLEWDNSTMKLFNNGTYTNITIMGDGTVCHEAKLIDNVLHLRRIWKQPSPMMRN